MCGRLEAEGLWVLGVLGGLPARREGTLGWQEVGCVVKASVRGEPEKTPHHPGGPFPTLIPQRIRLVASRCSEKPVLYM